MKKPVLEDSSIDVSQYNLVMIEWIDIVSSCDWESLKNVILSEPLTSVEVGWLIYEDKKKMILVSQVNGSECGNRTVLPKSIVKKVTKL